MGKLSSPEIIPETVHLVPSLVQDCHDSNIAISEQLPIDEMALVAADLTIDPELSRHQRPRKPSLRYSCETCEQATDIALGLRAAPIVSRMAVDLIQPVRGAAMDSESAHASGRC